MGRLPEGSKEEKFEFINQERDSWSIRYLCRYLKVSHQGYYQWLNRKLMIKDSSNDDLLRKINKIFFQHKGRYGIPRVYAELRRQGVLVNHKRVARLMRISGLVGGSRTSLSSKAAPSKYLYKSPK